MTLAELRYDIAVKLRNKLESRNYQLAIQDVNIFNGLTVQLEDATQSSAKLMNDLINGIVDELNIQEETVDAIYDIYEFWLEQKLSQLRSLAGKIKDLRSQVDDLILVTDKTDGFFYTVGDDFVDLNNIDIDSSTASIDTSSGLVSASLDPNIKTQDEVQVTVIPTISFDVLADSVPESSLDLLGYEIDKIYDRSLDSSWIHKIVLGLPSANPVVGTLSFDFKEVIIASHLELIAGNNYAISPYIVDIIASTDGVSWTSVTTKTDFNGVLSLPLNIQSFRFVKIFLGIKNPTTYENGKAVYQFHIKEVRLFANQYIRSSVLYTKELAIGDENENPVKFSSVSLKTCEIIPEGADIDCFISFGNNGIFSSYQSIEPINRDPLAIVHVNTSLVKSVSTNALDNTLKFPYNYNNNSTIDFEITDSISTENLQIIRNLGNWTVNADWYTLVYYLSSNTELDFRTYNVYINGIFKNTKETYDPGVYILRTNLLDNLTPIKDYILSKTSHVGGYLATLMDISEFSKIDANNYNYFSITPTRSSSSGPYDKQHIMLKNNTSTEIFKVIYVSSANNSTADSFKLRFDLISNSNYTNSPILDKYSIKANKIL